jgi:hypothetical protein
VSSDACPACGEPSGPFLSGRGAVLASHEVDGPACRLAGWARESRERGLVRVVGKVALELTDLGLAVYGPFFLNVDQANADARILRAEGAQPWDVEKSIERAPRRVTSTFAPLWAVMIVRAFGKASAQSVRAVEFVRADEGLQRAVAAAAMMADGAAGARRAVADLVRSAIKEADRSKADGDGE